MPKEAAPDVERIPLDQLVLYPGNARIHNDAAIRESLTVNGQYRPIVAQRSTRQVLVGNGTLSAARELGWSSIEVRWADVDDAAARRIVLADNRTADLASYDEAALVAMLQTFEADLAGTAFSEDDLEDLLVASGAEAVLPQGESDAEYAEDQAAIEYRRNKPYRPLVSDGMKEVVLVLTAGQVEGFREDVDALKEVWGTESMTTTVIRACRECRQPHPDSTSP